MEITERHHLRDDEVRDIRTAIRERLGVDVEGETFERVRTEEADLVLVDGDPHVFAVEEEPFLTVRGANAYPPTRHTVTVDDGAVSFVSDGADVMRPGIVAADPDIEAGDLVVVTEERHGKALAVGRARVDGEEMPGDAGKVVDSIHHVGDDLYAFEP